MRIDKFTIKSQEALAEAQSLAGESGHAEVTAEHLLLALLTQADGIVRPVLAKLGVDPSIAERRLGEILEKRPKVFGASPYVSPALKVALDASLQEAEKLRDEYVSTEHLLLGILSSGERLLLCSDPSGSPRRASTRLWPRCEAHRGSWIKIRKRNTRLSKSTVGI